MKQIKSSLQSGFSKDEEAEKLKDLKNMFGKSLAINRNLSEGHVLTVDDLEAKKPAGFGIPAKEYLQVIGKSIKCEMKQWDFLTSEHIQYL